MGRLAVLNPMSALPQFLSELSSRQFVTIAGHTVLTYDYLLTFDLEVDYIWHAPWTTTKVIFLLNRYGTLIGQSCLTLEELGMLSDGSQKFCINFQWFQAFVVLFSTEATRSVVLLRAWALWRFSYRVTVSLVSIYVLYVLVLSGYASYVISNYGAYFYFPYLDKTDVCVIFAQSATDWLLGFIPLLLDTGLFAMITYYLYKLYNESKQLQHSALIRLLVRDAVLFYMVAILYDVLGILTLSIFLDDPRNYLQMGLAFPLLTVTGQRVVLNLRGLQAHSYTTEDIDRDVDRQIAAMRHRSFWQSVDVWMNDPHQELELDEELRWYRTTRTTESRVTEEGSSYELEAIRTRWAQDHAA